MNTVYDDYYFDTFNKAMGLQNLTEKKELLTKLLIDYPNDLDIMRELAFFDDDPIESLNKLKRTINLDDISNSELSIKFCRLYLDLYSLYTDIGDFENAISNILAAYELDIDDQFELCYKIAPLLLLANHIEEFEKYLLNDLDSDDSTEAIFAKLYYYTLLNDNENFLSFLNKLIVSNKYLLSLLVGILQIDDDFYEALDEIDYEPGSYVEAANIFAEYASYGLDLKIVKILNTNEKSLKIIKEAFNLSHDEAMVLLSLGVLTKPLKRSEIIGLLKGTNISFKNQPMYQKFCNKTAEDINLLIDKMIDKFYLSEDNCIRLSILGFKLVEQINE